MHDVTERPAQDTTGTIGSSPQTRGRVLVSWTSVPLQLSGAMGFGARSADFSGCCGSTSSPPRDVRLRSEPWGTRRAKSSGRLWCFGRLSWNGS